MELGIGKKRGDHTFPKLTDFWVEFHFYFHSILFHEIGAGTGINIL
jgi:hypothetical protein